MNIYQQNFTIYCTDLQKTTGVNFDFNIKTPSFSEQIDIFFEKHPENLSTLKQADLCIIAHDKHESNPRYSHVGTYLINHYQLSCDIFDVIGDGLMPAQEVGVHLALQYMAFGKNKCIVFEICRVCLTMMVV